jgi:hypothetical protein
VSSPGLALGGRGAETRQRGGAGAFHARAGDAVLPGGEAAPAEEELGRRFTILAWVAHGGAAPRDRRRGP